MTRKEEIEAAALKRYPYIGGTKGLICAEDKFTFKEGAEWADRHPSDETIMKILNAIGYEEESWIAVVRNHLEKIKD